jgi:hypothetical protein
VICYIEVPFKAGLTVYWREKTKFDIMMAVLY